MNKNSKSGKGVLLYSYRQSKLIVRRDHNNNAELGTSAFPNKLNSIVVSGGTSPATTYPWLSRNSWLSHLKGVDIIKIRLLAELPVGLLKSQVAPIISATENMLHTTVKTFEEKSCLATRRWMASTISTKWGPVPFSLVPPETAKRYGLVLQKVVMYLVNVSYSGMINQEPNSRLLTLNDEQKYWLERIVKILKNGSIDSDELEGCIFGLGVGLITQEFDYEDSLMVPILHCLAVLGVDPETWTYRSTKEISSDLDGVLYNARLLLMRQAYESPPLGISKYDYFHDLHHRFLVSTEMSPMAELIKLSLWLMETDEAIQGLRLESSHIPTRMVKPVVVTQAEKGINVLPKNFSTDQPIVHTRKRGVLFIEEGSFAKRTRINEQSSVETIYFSNGFPCIPRISGPPSGDIIVRSTNILRRLYGPNGKFKSAAQGEGLQFVLQGVSPLIVILPTGGGKSILFEGPALESKGSVTVVIVPFVALRSNLYHRSLDAGIESREWTGSTACRSTPLIFVTAEGAVTNSFKRYIKLLLNAKKLDRVIIDEAHMLVIASSFRKAYHDLDWYSALGVQCVFLTATLPSFMVSKLKFAALIKNCKVVRHETKRSNIAYHVVVTGKVMLFDKAVSLIERFKAERIQAKDKAIIYTRSIQDCKELAERLQCGMYFAEHSRKAIDLERWISGQYTILVATTALGAGIDVSTISLVIHFKSPYLFIDFSQGSGRAGRDGRPSKSVFLISPEDLKNSKSDFPEDLTALRAYLSTEGCRRMELSRYFDGAAKECVTGEDELCDNCERQAEKFSTATLRDTGLYIPKSSSRQRYSPIIPASSDSSGPEPWEVARTRPRAGGGINSSGKRVPFVKENSLRFLRETVGVKDLTNGGGDLLWDN